MARFFKAPVVQPIDYGYDIPFAETFAVLQQKQKEQDTALGEVQALRDKPINANEWYFDTRNKVLEDRDARLDAIQYDDKGNLRDLTQSLDLIQKEARRQVKEEQPGGIVHALETDYANRNKYIEQLDEMAKKEPGKGGISKARRDFLLQFSDMRERGRAGAGVGITLQPGGQFGPSQLYSGETAAKEFDEFKLAEGYSVNWKPNQIQTAKGPNGVGLVRFSDAAIQDLRKKYPKEMAFVGPPGQSGDYVQTGALEYVLFEEVYGHTRTALARHEELNQDLAQEALQYGAQNPQQVQAYVNQRLDEAAAYAAEKESRFKFSPTVRDNWRKKKQVDFYYKKKTIDYEREKEKDMRIFQTQTHTTQRKFKVSDITKRKNEAQEMIKSRRDMLANKFEDENGNVLESVLNNKQLYDEYKGIQNEIRQHQGTLDKLNGMMNHFLTNDPETLKGMKETALTRRNLSKAAGSYINDLALNFGQNLAGAEWEYARDYNKIVGVFKKGIGSLSDDQLKQIITSSDPESLSFIKNMKEQMHQELGEAGFTGWTPGTEKQMDDMIGNLIGQMKGSVQKRVEDPNLVVNYTQQQSELHPFSGSGKGREGSMLARKNTLRKSIIAGDEEFIDQATGTVIDVRREFIKRGVDPDKMVLEFVRDRDPDTGEIPFVVKGKDEDGNPFSMTITTKPGSTTSTSLNGHDIEDGITLVKTATGKEADATAKENYELGVEKIAFGLYARDLYSSNLTHGGAGAKQRLGNSLVQVRKTETDKYVIENLVRDDLGNLVPDPNEDTRYIHDTRLFQNYSSADEVPYMYNTLNDVAQVIGHELYDDVQNRLK